MPLPLQHQCDQSNPAEAFLWALTALPGPAHGPMLVPIQVLEKWSQRLWDLGFRHHPECQTLEYQPPPGGNGHWLSSVGRWVPVGTPAPPEVTTPNVADLTAAQRQVLIAQLQESGELAHLVDRGLLEPDQAEAGTAYTTTPPAGLREQLEAAIVAQRATLPDDVADSAP